MAHVTATGKAGVAVVSGTVAKVIGSTSLHWGGADEIKFKLRLEGSVGGASVDEELEIVVKASANGDLHASLEIGNPLLAQLRVSLTGRIDTAKKTAKVDANGTITVLLTNSASVGAHLDAQL